MVTAEILQTARQIVRQAGLRAKDLLDRSHIVREKAFGDIVTDGDLLVEALVISALKKHFPDHGFDSEEGAPERTDAEYVWLLDPIDGTKYYFRNIPLYSVSLALMHRGQPVLGIVYSPENDRMYCAALGCGATLNDQPIRCSSEARIDKASLCIEIPSRDASRDERGWAMEKMAALVEHTYRVRILGVGALGLCFTAAGGFDAYVNLAGPWKPCDIAAGQIILTEADGQFLTFGRKIIAGPPALCAELRDLLHIS